MANPQVRPSVAGTVDSTEGPGLQEQTEGKDGVSITAIVFAVLGLTPRAVFGSTLGVEAFGPVAFPVIFAIVGIMFGLLTIIRHGELQNPLALKLGVVALAIGLTRVFLYPLFGW